MSKFLISSILCFIFIAIASNTSHSACHPSEYNEIIDSPVYHLYGWQKLGSKKVNFGADYDELYVTAQEGVFSKIRIKTEKSDIYLNKAIVVFRNGQSQVVKINQNIKEGTLSRPLDLYGKKRIIRKVKLFYKTKGYEGKKAKVTIYGK